MSVVQRRDYENLTMKKTISQITSKENKYLLFRISVAFILYIATLFVYLGVFKDKEEDEDVSGLAYLNPVFIMFTDIVILSLREQTVKIRKREGQGSFIYSPTFQSVILLFSRVLLCFNKEYWLMNQALVYFIVQCLCAYDATQTVFLRNENVRDEQNDMIEILRVCPVLQAKVQN